MRWKYFLIKNFLKSIHPKEKPYYTNDYIKKVKSWQNKLSEITKPTLYIVTRNAKKEIDYIYENYFLLHKPYNKLTFIKKIFKILIFKKPPLAGWFLNYKTFFKIFYLIFP
jgi:hypothetical protein